MGSRRRFDSLPDIEIFRAPNGESTRQFFKIERADNGETNAILRRISMSWVGLSPAEVQVEIDHAAFATWGAPVLLRMEKLTQPRFKLARILGLLAAGSASGFGLPAVVAQE